MKKLLLVSLLFASLTVRAAGSLRIVSAGPVGETATLAEANEIRVVFSEPMVVLGRIPSPVTAPFFTLDPAVKGTFRWSGTTTLIFTPEKPLPFATTFNVSIDRSAKSVSGATLDKPYAWSFTTPTIRLLGTDWYRRPNGAIVIALSFNQPVDGAALLPHLQLLTEAHQAQLPPIPERGVERLRKTDPDGLAAYEAKVSKSRAAAASNGRTIFAFLPTDWDRKRFAATPARVVLETQPGIAPDTWIRVQLDDRLAASSRNVRSERQTNVLELSPALFVNPMDCLTNCDPEQRNALNFRTGPGLRFADVQKAVSVLDVTDAAKEVAVKPKSVSNDYDYPSWSFGLDELGYSLQPARTYAVRVDPALTAVDGQTLGYPFVAVIENGRKSAFVSFGSGHGVWESSGGSVLPFHARNFRSVKQWLAPLSVEQLMPTMLAQRNQDFSVTPDVKPATRKLDLPMDRIAAIGLDLAPILGSDNRGLVWAAIQPGDAVAKSQVYNPSVVATLVQSTNLGISVKDSPLNTIVMVTRLDDAKPVAGANVSIRNEKNEIVWSGTTGADGIALAPNTDLRRTKDASADPWESSWRALGELHFVVIAEKDGDVAYIGSDWTEGLVPWEFGLNFNLAEAEPLLRGTIFADRGVYKPGEEIHFKAIARSDSPSGIDLLPAGTKLDVTLRDSQGKDVDTRTIELNAWSSAEWTYRVPAEAALGNYNVLAVQQGAKERGAIAGELIVAAYRRPDFRVETTLVADSPLAGTKLAAGVLGRYLFGAPMDGRPVKWTYSRLELVEPPRAIAERWPADRWQFLGRDYDDGWPSVETLSQGEKALDSKAEFRTTLETPPDAGAPYDYRFEAVVTDVTRQQIANRSAVRIEGAPWYIGVKRPPFFAEAKDGIDTEIVAAGLDGLAVAGVPVKVQLLRLQWTSVRQSEGEGFYGWQSERKEVPAGEWTIESKSEPVPLHVDLAQGGEYLLVATAGDPKGSHTRTRLGFYVVGEGYTAWQRDDHNRIELVPEKPRYQPGDTARIMVKSPWETATALLTTEREGVRTWRQFELTSTQQTLSVPITARDIPNVYVSVLLVKGRTKQDPGRDGSDPGKPAFRLGYVELKVEDASKRLDVEVKANRDEFRPAQKAKIEVTVVDAARKPSQSEVTLWAVDYGVLSLTNYTPPDVMKNVYLEKALQVLTEDSRQRIVSRRVLTPKGATDGGGGGRDAGPGSLRKDFRVLAFWLGSVVTDAKGRARTEITLPESLTTYRIMAVAADRQSRFGWDQAELKINKPLMLTPAWPRFLASGDAASFGAVVHSQLKKKGTATVSIESLDPQILSFASTSTKVEVPAGGNVEVRFDAKANAIGTARVRMRVAMGRENDAFEDVIPVRVLVSPETVAAYGDAKPRAEEKLRLPANVVPGFGGLHVDLSSTAMVGLTEGVRYLVEYPYGCAEQRASRSLALMLAADLGSAFTLPGIDPGKEKVTVQTSLNELANFQCGDGGFAFWPGQCWSTSPFLTSWVVHVFQRGSKLGYRVDQGTLDRAYGYLEQRLNEPPPTNEGWRPAYNAWQAFAIKVLAEGGRNVDSPLERVYAYRDRMPVFGLSFLADALQARGETKSERMAELKRRIGNAVSPEGGFAFVNELADPYLLWFWNSNVRSTSIVLGTLVRGGEDEEQVKRMVRWLMKAQKQGRWNDTQENAWTLEALVDFYRRYEAETPDFLATVQLGSEELARETFKGRSTAAKSRDFTMTEVLKKAAAGTELPVVFTREGTGTLYYMLRLRYAADVVQHQPLDSGFHIERSYALDGGSSPATSFKAGDLIEVTLKIRNTKERRFVAVTDPIPAGTEPIESWFATTSSQLAQQQDEWQRGSYWAWWERGGWDHVERHDDRVNVFATRLGEGEHVFKYLVRATTAGTFIAAPAHAEEMYEPEVFGRTATATVEVAK
jgi:uncharacterized protein YfaS (alpha-2-macroglobulin family)